MGEVRQGERTDVEPAAAGELDLALQQVNRIRLAHGLDPIFELPRAQPALVPGSSCVLQEAFADMGVAYVDYRQLVGPGLRLDHDLGWFVRRFDEGAYPQLVARNRP